MKKFLQKKLKDQKGMTLIELLAVIVIIAIIAAIAIPAIGSIIENSRVGAVKSDAINIINAAKLYEADNNAGGTTVTLTQLEAGGFVGDAGTFEDLSATDKGTVVVNFATANPTLTGANKAENGIVLTFAGADIAAINSLPNGTATGSASAGGLGTVTVTSR